MTQPKLSQLREIGWTLWNPIRILRFRDDAPDEYDTYLSKTADMLRTGTSDADCIEYLIDIECNYMGIDMSDDTHTRATATVAAIRKII